MVVGQVLSPVHSLGPGERVCLWTQGCRKRCDGCISPELQSPNGAVMDNGMLAEALGSIAKKHTCTGLTVSGGDPFEQAEHLLELLRLVRDVFEDILVYTGYTLAEIERGDAGEAGQECLRYIDVLIDGRYERKLNTRDCVLRGSSNQVIHFLTAGLEPRYAEYMKRGRVIESFAHGGKVVLTGILNEEESQ